MRKSKNSIWITIEISDYVDIVRGYAFKTSDYESKGYPIVRVTNISTLGQLNLTENMVYLSTEREDEFNSILLRDNDFLMVMVGATIGKYAKVITKGQKLFLNQNMWCLRVKQPEYNSQKFAFYALQKVIDIFLRNMQGSARNFFTQSEFGKAIIELPPLPEQKKIVEVLSSIEECYKKINHKISKLINLRHCIQSNFIPNKKNQSFLKCKELSLNSFCERVLRNSSENVKDVLTISSTQGWIDQKRKWSRNMAGKSIEKYILLKKGEFSYNKGNSKTYPQGCVFRLDQWQEALVPNVYHSFRINNEIVDSDYLQVFFASGGLNEDLRKVITSSVRGNGLLNITANTFFNQTIMLPSLSDQRNIAKRIINLNSQIESLKNKLSKIEFLKQSISQEILSGPKRITI